MQLTFLACLTETSHCAYSSYALNELYHAQTPNNSTTRKKFKILSFYPTQDAVSEKPSHAIVLHRYCMLPEAQVGQVTF
jgi:hypothetical protein